MGPHGKSSAESRDSAALEALAGRLIEEILERVERGEDPGLEEACRRHPEIAPALRDACPGILALSPAIPASPAPAATGPGSILGDFRLLREIRGGGMGVVFEAEQVSLQRRVAVKILPWTLGLSAEGRRRFRREAEALAKLNDPGVVSVLGVGETAGVHWLAMELVDGEPLDAMIRAWRDEPPGAAAGGRRARIERAATLGAAVAHALEAVHRAGLLHRDVKPSNVLVRRDGSVKLIDFGLARGGHDLVTATGQSPGTPAYMSPEQIAGRSELDGRADVYALGATLYEMLVLRRPFEGETASALRHPTTRDPRRPRDVDARVPRDLETIVMRCLERSRDDRYPSAAALADDLERFLRFEPIQARPPGPARRLAKLVRRRPVESATIGAAVLLLCGFLAWQAVDAAARRRGQVGRELESVRGALARFEAATTEVIAEEPRLTEAGWLLEREFMPESRRAVLAESRRRVVARAREADQHFQDALFGIQTVLALEPECAAAFELGADLYLARWRRAVAARDDDQAALLAREVERYDRGGRRLGMLEGLATVSFAVTPAGVAPALFRFRPRREVEPDGDDRLVAVLLEDQAARRLPHGSYLAVFRAPGFEDLRFPFALDRGEHQAITAEMLPEGTTPPGFVHVPGGPVWLGGDAGAFTPRARRRVDVPSCWIAKFETTVGEYVDFVNDPEVRERIDEARDQGRTILLPRDPANPAGNTLTKGQDGKFRARWPLDWPILSISFEDAAEYAAWRTRKAAAAGEPFEYDLPDPDQWEKAARGADERIHPWGSTFEWSFCKGNLSKPTSAPEPVGSYPADESPYGVRDMAGSIREWNKGWLNSENRLRPIRGGAWSSSMIAHFRAASWLGTDPGYFETAYGFRLVARRRK